MANTAIRPYRVDIPQAALDELGGAYRKSFGLRSARDRYVRLWNAG